MLPRLCFFRISSPVLHLRGISSKSEQVSAPVHGGNWMLAGKRKLWGIAGLAIVAAVVAGSAGAVVAVGGDNEQPITGEAYEKATEAALDHTGGGRVTGTEVGDEESYYEVEVTRDDGSQVDVQLDESFSVVGDKADNDSHDNDGDGD
jgi:hypothetical protein